MDYKYKHINFLPLPQVSFHQFSILIFNSSNTNATYHFYDWIWTHTSYFCCNFDTTDTSV